MDRQKVRKGLNRVESDNSIVDKAALLDALPESVLMLGEDFCVRTVNAAAEKMFEVSSPPLVGQHVRDVVTGLVDDDGLPVDMEPLVRRCAGSREVQFFDAWVCPDDTSQGVQYREPDKRSVMIVPVDPAGRDSAEEKGSVAVVVKSAASLESYTLRDTVLSMVSHELRTPLLHIKGFVSSLLESDIEWDEETKLDFLHTIDRETDKLTSMVKDLTEITRMGSSDMPLLLEPTDPYLLAYSAVDSASPFVRKHRVLVEVPEDLPLLDIDPIRVTGVLVNLLQNASKYSAEGSGIVIGAEAGEGDVTFSVTDEGTGIPADALRKIFSLFYRSTNTRSVVQGTGLGLAVCRAVINAHGGKIWAESEEERGACFKFTLPIGASEPNSVKSEESPELRIRRATSGPGEETETRRIRSRQDGARSKGESSGVVLGDQILK